MSARVAVIYYSATGNVHALAQSVADGAEAAGVEVRRRHVEELASERLISPSRHWGRHRPPGGTGRPDGSSPQPGLR